MTLSSKAYTAAAAAALALVAVASLPIMNAKADDAQKDLYIKTERPAMKGVKVYIDASSSWSACIQTPDPNTPASANLKVGPGALSLRGFSTADCFEGDMDPTHPGDRINSSQIYTGWADVNTTVPADPMRVVLTPR